jgi:2'-5' RNA ligase
MSRIAVDVVLLPNQAMTERAIRINERLAGPCRDQIVLNKETCLPHISLAMGCIDERDIGQARDHLQKLARECPVRQLRAVGITTPADASAGSTGFIEIEKSGELQTLHEAVMREMEPLFSHDVTETTIHDNDVAESTLTWIREYPRKAAFGRFSPHITLGYGLTRTDESFPIAFTVSRLALCHLGNHCTCRAILASVDLP